MQLAIPSYISPRHDIFLKDFSNTLHHVPPLLSVQIQYKYGRNTVQIQHKSKYNTRPTRALLLTVWLPGSPAITLRAPPPVLFTQKLGPQTTDGPLLIPNLGPISLAPSLFEPAAPAAIMPNTYKYGFTQKSNTYCFTSNFDKNRNLYKWEASSISNLICIGC